MLVILYKISYEPKIDAKVLQIFDIRKYFGQKILLFCKQNLLTFMKSYPKLFVSLFILNDLRFLKTQKVIQNKKFSTTTVQLFRKFNLF